MKEKRIHGYGALVILLILSLTAFACGGSGDGDGQDETTQSSAAGSTEPSGSGSSPVTGGQTTTSQSPGEQTTVSAGSTTTAASTGDLTSYRIHTTWRDGSREGPVKTEWDTAYVADPLAVHHKAEGDVDMEMVLVGETLWTRFMDLPWQKTELPEGETAEWASMLSEAESLVDVEEQTPVENDIQWLMGQSEVKIAEGSLTPAGEETVNGVTCKRYTVDSTYIYSVEYQAPLSAKATLTEGTQGEIWVADQEGWSPFMVRAQLLQTTTTEVEGGPSGTEIVYIEEDVTDINSSDIVIEPPQS